QPDVFGRSGGAVEQEHRHAAVGMGGVEVGRLRGVGEEPAVAGDGAVVEGAVLRAAVRGVGQPGDGAGAQIFEVCLPLGVVAGQQGGAGAEGHVACVAGHAHPVADVRVGEAVADAVAQQGGDGAGSAVADVGGPVVVDSVLGGDRTSRPEQHDAAVVTD